MSISCDIAVAGAFAISDKIGNKPCITLFSFHLFKNINCT
ncbi:hypothetical protein SAMN04488029_3712 [Reichenbachiella faecimaris]|uniref:Uncharacterized protein n=1 Tax=Reichenbachiella faecimaris TaxID=692418 RepID=A0A1W2GNN9_REIFA|nr:hypothetical protein SAMN04488029_3712 [Reichenbachiella faecimaris]